MYPHRDRDDSYAKLFNDRVESIENEQGALLKQ
jgi:hypothetical protein